MALANALPQVIAACEKAHTAIDAAVKKEKTALEIDPRALEEAVSASFDRTTATAAVEILMQKTLRAVLDEVFSKAGTLPKLLDEAKEELVDAAGESSGNAGRLVQDGAELGLPRVLHLLRSTVENYADPLLKRLDSGVADEVCRRFLPSAAAATRLRSLNMVSDQSDATEQLLKPTFDDPPLTVYRKALHTLLDNVSACLDDPSAVAQQWVLLASEKGHAEVVKAA